MTKDQILEELKTLYSRNTHTATELLYDLDSLISKIEWDHDSGYDYVDEEIENIHIKRNFYQ